MPTPTHGSIQTNNDDQSDLIPLSDLISLLWKSRIAILIITLLVVGCGVAWSFLNLKYRSEGVFQFGAQGIVSADFSRHVAASRDPVRLADFLSEQKKSSPGDMEGLEQAFGTINLNAWTVEPVYSVDSDPKTPRNVVGMRIAYASESPENARKIVTFLGDYILDSIVYSFYSQELPAAMLELKEKSIALELEASKKRTQLKVFDDEAKALKEIVTRYSRLAEPGTMQIVEVTEETAHYLPPMTLLMGVEVQAAGAHVAIEKAKRDQMQNALLSEYYGRAHKLLDTMKSGENLLRALNTVKVEIFKSKDLKNNYVNDAYNMISLENQRALNLYLDNSRFISPPTLPTRSTGRPIVTLAASIMIGLLLSFLFVFARDWISKKTE